MQMANFIYNLTSFFPFSFDEILFSECDFLMFYKFWFVIQF